MMEDLPNRPKLGAEDTPITSVQHRQQPWDINFLDKIRGLVVMLYELLGRRWMLCVMLLIKVTPRLASSWDRWATSGD